MNPYEIKPNIYKQAIETFGENSQMLKCAEECSELAQRLIKKALNPKLDNYDIYSELADVEIMLAQMHLIFNDHNEFIEVKDFKLNRLQQRIDDFTK